MAVVGMLIAESLRVEGVLEIPLTITRIVRSNSGDVDAGQPRTWTAFEFEVADDAAERLVGALEDALEPVGGWYCDLRNATDTFVVFAGRTFRYPRGDSAGRAAAAEYGRSVGVPEAQLDWPV